MTMSKRSSHMPIMMAREIRNSRISLRRTSGSHNSRSMIRAVVRTKPACTNELVILV
jgi:hypothetical protein